MAKIPYSLASGEVPGRIPLSDWPQPAVWALPGRAIQNLGAEVETSSEKLVDAERRIQAVKDHLFANQVLSGLELQMDEDRQRMAKEAFEGTAAYSAQDAQRMAQESAQAFLNEKLIGVTDDRVRAWVRSEAASRIARGSILTRGAVSEESLKQVDAMSREEIAALTREGTAEAMAQAQDILSMNTRAGVWRGDTAQSIREQIRAGTLSNAFGRDLQADARGAYHRVLTGQGVYGQLSDAEKQRYIAAAKDKMEHDEDRAWTALAREQQVREWDHAETVRVKRERSENTAGEISRRAVQPGADIGKLIVETNQRGPGAGGTGELTADDMRVTVGYLHSIRTDAERGDPEQYAKALKQIVDAKSAGTVPRTTTIMSWPGIGWKEKATLLQQVESRVNLLENKALAAEARARAEDDRATSQRAQALSRAHAAMESMLSVSGMEAKDPSLVQRITDAKNVFTQELLEVERRKEDPWDYWEKTVRARAEQTMGSELSRAIRRVEVDLGGLGSAEDYQARLDTGYYKGNDEAARRDLAALRTLTTLRDIETRVTGRAAEIRKEGAEAKARKTAQEAQQKKTEAVAQETQETRPLFQDVPYLQLAP